VSWWGDSSLAFTMKLANREQDALGNDCYAEVKRMGRYKECKRTWAINSTMKFMNLIHPSEGISTTSIIQRILEPNLPRPDPEPLQKLLKAFIDSCGQPQPPMIDLSITNLSSIALPKPNPELSPLKRIYLAESWDCFGSAHVEYLRRAKYSCGTEGYLVIGVWSDEVSEIRNYVDFETSTGCEVFMLILLPSAAYPFSHWWTIAS
jgi:ethanolamine-phosphate cytidylyltransferase